MSKKHKKGEKGSLYPLMGNLWVLQLKFSQYTLSFTVMGLLAALTVLARDIPLALRFFNGFPSTLRYFGRRKVMAVTG